MFDLSAEVSYVPNPATCALEIAEGPAQDGPYPAAAALGTDGLWSLSISLADAPAGLAPGDVSVQPGDLVGGVFTPNGPAIPGTLTSDQAVLDVAYTLGPPQTSVAVPNSNVLPANSDGDVHVKVEDVSNADGTPADPSGGPVAFAITQGTPSPADFQPGDWLRVTTPAAAAGLYARLAVSVSAGTALPAGEYRVYVQIGGTVTLRCPGFLAVQG